MLKITNIEKATRALRELQLELLIWAVPEYGMVTHRTYHCYSIPPKRYLLLIAYKLRDMGNPKWSEIAEDVE